MIDLHCHMLPAIDDGARDLDTALRMAELAVADGITLTACTPHINPGLFDNTHDQVVMQLDIGNCADGGGDPIAMLQKYPGRAKSVHLKDYGGGPELVLGEGDADWDEIFRLCETLHHPEWYVVEQGEQAELPFDVSRRSLENLRRMGK